MNISLKFINLINNFLTKDLNIDYTFLNTVSINNLKIRLKKRRNLNKYDKFNSYFYTKVQKGYLKLAKNKKNYLIVNSDKDISLNKKIIKNKIEKLIYN